MAKKLAVRVDDRLIHGQVVTQWVNVFKAQHIVVIDNNVAKDKMQKSVLKFAAPPGYQSQYFLCGQSRGSLGEKPVRFKKCVCTFPGCKTDCRTAGEGRVF